MKESLIFRTSIFHLCSKVFLLFSAPFSLLLLLFFAMRFSLMTLTSTILFPGFHFMLHFWPAAKMQCKNYYSKRVCIAEEVALSGRKFSQEDQQRPTGDKFFRCCSLSRSSQLFRERESIKMGKNESQEMRSALLLSFLN